MSQRQRKTALWQNIEEMLCNDITIQDLEGPKLLELYRLCDNAPLALWRMVDNEIRNRLSRG